MRISLIVFLAFFGATQAVWAQTVTVEDARFADTGTHTQVTFTLSETVQPRIFTLPADSGRPYRLVIDLPEVNWAVPGGTTLAGRGVVQQLRYGVNRPGTSRIVLDMPLPAVIEGYQMGANDAGAAMSFRLVPTDHAGFVAASAMPIEGLGGVSTATSEPDSGNPTYDSIEAVLASLEGQGTASATPVEQPPMVRPVIVIDPGHGGHDPGSTTVLGDLEKDIVLDLSRVIVVELNASGLFEAHLTRDGDEYLRLNDRYAIAQDLRADLFLSIHVDSNNDADARGVTVYTLSEDASDDEAARVAARENESDRLAGYEVDEELTRILIDLAQRETMNLSAELAAIVIDNFGEGSVNTVSRPHRFAGFRVLTAPDVPSILLETGFGSNRQDANLLVSEAYHQTLARALTAALIDYFELDREVWLAENAAAQD